MAPSALDPSDRRLFRRVQADVLVRPVSFLARAVKRRVQDLSVGGLRIYSDEKHRPGSRLELELFFRDETSATFLAEVVWVTDLPEGAPALHDVGLRFVDVRPGDLARVHEALGEAPPEE
jgi:PilZ domain